MLECMFSIVLIIERIWWFLQLLQFGIFSPGPGAIYDSDLTDAEILLRNAYRKKKKKIHGAENRAKVKSQ